MPWEYVAQTFERWVDRSTVDASIDGVAAAIGEGLTAIDNKEDRVYTVVLGWLAGLFAVMAAMLALAAAVVGWPILLLALPLAGVAYLFWYHASGRLTEKLRQQARHGRTARRGGSARSAAAASAGPRGFGIGQRAAGRRGTAGGRGARDRRRRRTDQRQGRRAPEPPNQTGMNPSTARGVLGVGADADADAVRSAYRSKVKDVHPDRGGSTEAFKRVNEAYETLGEAA